MARRQFLDNLRLARNLYVHPRVSTDSRQLDPHSLARRLGRAAIWLTPSSVEGFDSGDFPELAPERRRELSQAVHEFQAAARRVAPAGAATDAQYQAGAAALERILTLLDSYLPTPEEDIRVREAVQTVEMPSAVVNWDYELGSDADDVPAVWVTVFLDDSIAPSTQFGRLASDLTARIRRALSTQGINRWPYVRVRTVAEPITR